MNDATPDRPSAASHPGKIGLLSPCGWGNLGDAAIQDAVIQHIRRYLPGSEIVGFSLNPSDTAERHGIRCLPLRCDSGGPALPGISRSHASASETPAPVAAGTAAGLKATIKSLPFVPATIRFVRRRLVRPLTRPWRELGFIVRAWRWLRDFDAIIVSGGGQLDDYWGGAWAQPWTLFRWALLCRLRGARFLVLSVGAHSLRTALSRAFVRWALRLADYRSYRDQVSRGRIERLGVRGAHPVFPDLAYSLEVPPPVSQRRRDGAVVVGLSPMAYFDPRAWPEKDQAVFRAYLDKLVDVVRWLRGRGYSIILIASEVDMDGAVVRDLCELLAQRGLALDGIRHDSAMTVDGILAQLGECDIVIASRLHAVLLATLLHKPVLALSYDPKVDILMGDLGQEAYCVGIEEFTPAALQERYDALEADRVAVSARLRETIAVYREALERQYGEVFGGLRGARSPGAPDSQRALSSAGDATT
jgi:polysaccharide pyruvyl transferase WcaK-like protein